MPETWRKPPQQDRSRRTDQRIVAAATRLIARHGYERLPVAMVAKAAKVSVGGLYARFADKQALVHAVDERLTAEFEVALAAAMDPAALAEADLAGVVTAYVTTMVGFFHRRRALLRQIVLRARSTTDAGFTSRIRALNQRAHGLLCGQLRAHRSSITHPDPDAAAAFGVLLVSAAAREVVLFGNRRLNLAAPAGRRLVGELVRAYCAYLGAPMPTPSA